VERTESRSFLVEGEFDIWTGEDKKFAFNCIKKSGKTVILQWIITYKKKKKEDPDTKLYLYKVGYTQTAEYEKELYIIGEIA
jgi:hypothetical protein